MANISDKEPEAKANQIATEEGAQSKEATEDKSKGKEEGFHAFIIVVFCSSPGTFKCQLKGLT